jgi:hypothetical protein
MTRLLTIVSMLATAACGGDDGGPFPINPGGGGSGSSELGPDAAIDLDAPTTIAGRVCMVLDARAPTTCAASGAGDLTVDLGAEQVTTAADGTFSITRPAGVGLVWGVTGTAVVASAMRLGSSNVIPAINANVYADMVSGTQPNISAPGAILARFTRAGVPVSNLSVTSAPTSDSGAYYDNASATSWDSVATSGGGVAWIPSIAAGTVTLGWDTGAASDVIENVPVFANVVTFVGAELP